MNVLQDGGDMVARGKSLWLGEMAVALVLPYSLS